MTQEEQDAILADLVDSIAEVQRLSKLRRDTDIEAAETLRRADDLQRRANELTMEFRQAQNHLIELLESAPTPFPIS